MDEKGLWELFFATGAPEVWMTIRRREGNGLGEGRTPADPSQPRQT